MMIPHDPIAEKDLLLKLRDGDYSAFDALYQTYARITLAKLKKLVHIKEVAEELHQDVFMKIWEQRELLPADVPFKAIVFRNAKSLAYNFYHKASLDKNLHDQLITSSTELYDQLEDHLNFRETNEAIMAAIAKLPTQRQKVFRMIKLEGKSYEEVAAEFGVSLSTIKDHMARAMKFLRDELTQQYPSVFFYIIAGAVFQ